MAFALVGFVIPASLSIVTYYWSRAYLLDNRQNSAVHQAEANAQLVAALLRASKPEVGRLVQSLQTPSDAQPLVLYRGSWFGTSAVAGPDALPATLVAAVARGDAARQRYHQRDGQKLAVGIPLAGGGAYFQIFSLANLDSTLATVRDALIAGSLLSFAISIALGAWATSRVLRPVRDIGRAAASIAAGRLDARLDAEGDRELVELATGFNAMVESLQARIERDARFASDVSHELRSPLTTLQSAVEVMRNRQGDLPERSSRAFDLLSDEVERFERMVEDLLEISRYDAGVALLDLEAVDVPALTKGLLTEAQQHAAVDVKADTDATILADRRRLEQALRNLIRNAVIHGGGVTRTAVEAQDGRTLIAIEDSGPGIPPAEREAIFERFARGRAAGRRSSGQGVGLGLALVAEHVRLQGGSVKVEDVEPHGSRFLIELPTLRP